MWGLPYPDVLECKLVSPSQTSIYVMCPTGLRKSLVNFQTPPRTVNRESPARAQPPLPKTSPSIHGDSHFSGGWERRFTTLAGAIHTLAGSIHTLVHTFWQGIRHFWRSLDRLRHSHTTLRQSLSLRRLLHSGAMSCSRPQC